MLPRKKPERNEGHERKISNKNDYIVTKRNDYSEESNKRNFKYYNRKIVEDRRKSRLFKSMKSEDDKQKSLTPIRKRPILIKSKTDSYIDASEKKRRLFKTCAKANEI